MVGDDEINLATTQWEIRSDLMHIPVVHEAYEAVTKASKIRIEMTLQRNIPYPTRLLPQLYLAAYDQI